MEFARVPMAVRRESIFFPHEGYHLYGAMYLPSAVDTRPLGVLICPPFADEAVHAHRVLVEWAMCLADAGIPAFLFDYTGTGDSEGEFEAGSLERYEGDIRGAISCFRARARVGRCGLVGLRLGANLAARVAAEDPRQGPLVLWAPISSLRDYFRGFLRLRLLTELSTLGRPTGTVRAAESSLRAGEPVEVLGYGIAPAMARGFLDSRDEAWAPEVPTLVVAVASRASQGEASAVGGDAMPAGGAWVTGRGIIDEAFWNRARVGRHAELFGVTLDWLTRTVTA